MVYRSDGSRFETVVEIEQRAEAAEQRIEAERQQYIEHTNRLTEKLRALGIDINSLK
ncbi:hypothetical protein CCP3SC1_2350002 [Gammaproteobacteria bacterium]